MDIHGTFDKQEKIYKDKGITTAASKEVGRALTGVRSAILFRKMREKKI